MKVEGYEEEIMMKKVGDVRDFYVLEWVFKVSFWSKFLEWV